MKKGAVIGIVAGAVVLVGGVVGANAFLNNNKTTEDNFENPVLTEEQKEVAVDVVKEDIKEIKATGELSESNSDIVTESDSDIVTDDDVATGSDDVIVEESGGKMNDDIVYTMEIDYQRFLVDLQSVVGLLVDGERILNDDLSMTYTYKFDNEKLKDDTLLLGVSRGGKVTGVSIITNVAEKDVDDYTNFFDNILADLVQNYEEGVDVSKLKGNYKTTMNEGGRYVKVNLHKGKVAVYSVVKIKLGDSVAVKLEINPLDKYEEVAEQYGL